MCFAVTFSQFKADFFTGHLDLRTAEAASSHSVHADSLYQPLPTQQQDMYWRHGTASNHIQGAF